MRKKAKNGNEQAQRGLDPNVGPDLDIDLYEKFRCLVVNARMRLDLVRDTIRYLLAKADSSSDPTYANLMVEVLEDAKKELGELERQMKAAAWLREDAELEDVNRARRGGGRREITNIFELVDEIDRNRRGEGRA